VSTIEIYASWDVYVLYPKNAIMGHNNNIYVCINQMGSRGNEPGTSPTHWQLLIDINGFVATATAAYVNELANILASVNELPTTSEVSALITEAIAAIPPDKHVSSISINNDTRILVLHFNDLTTTQVSLGAYIDDAVQPSSDADNLLVLGNDSKLSMPGIKYNDYPSTNDAKAATPKYVSRAIVAEAVPNSFFTPEATITPIAFPLYLKSIETANPLQVTANCNDDATDATAAVQAMASFPGKVRFKKGIYRVSTQLVVDNAYNIPPHWEFDNGAFIRFNISAGQQAFTVGASTRQNPTSIALTADVGVGAESLVVTSVSGLTIGMALRLCSEAIYDYRTSSKLGEMLVIDGIDVGTNTIHTAWPVKDTYLVSDTARIYAINLLKPSTFDNIGFIGDEGTIGVPKYSNGFLATYCDRIGIHDPNIEGFSTVTLRVQDCLDPVIHFPKTLITIPDPGNAYNISVMGITQGAHIKGHRSRGGRHSITTNNTNTVGRYGVVGKVIYEDAVVYSTQSTGDGIDTHAACREFICRNSEVISAAGNGVNTECTNVTLENVKVHKAVYSAFHISNYTERDGTVVLKNLDALNAGNYGAQIVQHPTNISNPASSGKMTSVGVSGFHAQAYTFQALYFKNDGLLSAETVVSLEDVVADANSSSLVTGQVYIESCKHLIVKPLNVFNIPYNGGGLRTLDIAQISGPDLGKATFRIGPSGQLPSGIGFYFNAVNALSTLTGRVHGATFAGPGNTARGFLIDSDIISGLTIESSDGDAATPISPVPVVSDVLAVWEARTIASDSITLTRETQLHWVQLSPESGLTDDIKSITPTGSTVIGTTILLTTSSLSFTFTVKHLASGGNIVLQSGRDLVLGYNRLILVWDGLKWYEPISSVAANSILAISSNTTITAITAPYSSVGITTGSSTITLTIPSSALAGDELHVYKEDNGTGIGSVYLGATLLANLYVEGDSVILKYTGSAWKITQVSIAPIVEMLTTTSTWTKPPLAKAHEIILVSPGGAGGSGRRGAAGTLRLGGGGGGSGSLMQALLASSAITSTVTVTIPSPPTGGAAITTDDTDGNSGATSVLASFGNYLYANSGLSGSGGTATSGSGGSHRAKIGFASNGASASTTTTPTTPTSAFAHAGGGGGTITAADTPMNGGAVINNTGSGQVIGGVAGGAVDGTNGANTFTLFVSGGNGGSGGAASITGPAGIGGNGSKYGGGGGGGGASLNGNDSGKGGNGGPGCCQITTFF